VTPQRKSKSKNQNAKWQSKNEKAVNYEAEG
jgi:hypothetical protein